MPSLHERATGAAEPGAARRRRLRVLYLLPFSPRHDAPHGGRWIAPLIADLATRHDVAVVHLRDEAEPPAEDVLSARGVIVREVPRRPPDRSRLSDARVRLRLARGLLVGRPLLVEHTRSAAFEAEAKNAVESFKPDVIHLEPQEMAQYLQGLETGAARRVLYVHDPGAAAADERVRSFRGLRRLARSADRWAWRRFEERSAAAVDALVVMTHQDEMALTSTPDRIVQIPLGFDFAAPPSNAFGEPPPMLLFMGGFAHLPNVDAAARLATEILPLVRARVPAAIVEVVGADPHGAVRNLASEHVIVRGHVPDLRPMLDRAAIVALPMRLGGGMRTKAVEALAAGKAVVATTRAVAGLQVVPGRDLVVADEDDAFADAVVHLLEDPDRRAELARSGRAWAQANAGWEQTVAAWEHLYLQLVEG